jgi:hypothetical protein
MERSYTVRLAGTASIHRTGVDQPPKRIIDNPTI